MSRVFEIDRTTGDLVRTGSRFSRVDGATAVRQGVQSRVQSFQGEWFLDDEFGIPYFQSILVKNPNLLAVREFFKSGVEDVAGVAEVLRMDLNRISGRKFKLTFECSTDLDEVVTGEAEV